MGYECIKCSYKITKQKIPQRCPYCGTQDTVKKTLTAQDLLNSIN